MELKELIEKAEQKVASAYEKYQKSNLGNVAIAHYYIDMSNVLVELLKDLKELDSSGKTKDNGL